MRLFFPPISLPLLPPLLSLLPLLLLLLLLLLRLGLGFLPIRIHGFSRPQSNRSLGFHSHAVPVCPKKRRRPGLTPPPPAPPLPLPNPTSTPGSPPSAPGGSSLSPPPTQPLRDHGEREAAAGRRDRDTVGSISISVSVSALPGREAQTV